MLVVALCCGRMRLEIHAAHSTVQLSRAYPWLAAGIDEREAVA